MAIKGGLTVFMHIPKTGGTTLLNVLSRFYKEGNLLQVNSVHTPLREIGIEKSKQAAPFLIKGHLSVDEVKNIPGSFLFTFLRAPVSRVISHYYYLKSLPSAEHYEYLNRPDTTIESFYALAEKKDLENCMVRYISGCFKEDFGKIGKEHYEIALENLQNKIHFFGMQDHYDESLIMLGNKLGWPLPVYRKKNMAKKKNAVSAQTLEFLKEANKWDILLFDEAKKIFAEKMNNMSEGERRKLGRLRFLNKIASAIPF